MDPLSELSSRQGDRTQAANLRVAERALAEPGVLARLAEGLEDPEAALVGDAAEVMAMVAARRPELVAPHAPALLPLLGHRHTRSRWEAMKALSLVSHLVPELLEPRLARLAELLETDSSVIVRDHVIDAAAGYGSTGPAALERALPILQQALVVREGRFAARALRGLARVAPLDPSLHPTLRQVAERYLGHERGSVRQAARRLLTAIR